MKINNARNLTHIVNIGAPLINRSGARRVTGWRDILALQCPTGRCKTFRLLATDYEGMRYKNRHVIATDSYFYFNAAIWWYDRDSRF
jgi:hypothetical protein